MHAEVHDVLAISKLMLLALDIISQNKSTVMFFYLYVAMVKCNCHSYNNYHHMGRFTDV